MRKPLRHGELTLPLGYGLRPNPTYGAAIAGWRRVRLAHSPNQCRLSRQHQRDGQSAVAVFREYRAAVLFGDLRDQRQAEAAVFFAV